jgi:hypothetical protein
MWYPSTLIQLSITLDFWKGEHGELKSDKDEHWNTAIVSLIPFNVNDSWMEIYISSIIVLSSEIVDLLEAMKVVKRMYAFRPGKQYRELYVIRLHCCKKNTY